MKMVEEDLQIGKKSKEKLSNKTNINQADSIEDINYADDVKSIQKINEKIVPSSDFNLDIQIKKLKHALNDWREIVLPVKSMLLWEKQWHPGALVGGCTIFFMLLWLMDPSLLTTLSVLGLILTISDYLVPSLANSVFKSEVWTPAKEKEFEEICSNIIFYKEKISLSLESFYLLRTTKPKLYYTLTITTLFLLAWIGNSFNNLFLTYLFVICILLAPGLDQHGMLSKYGVMVTKKFNDLASTTKAKDGLKKTQ